uniref:ER membrane protein complex subunit 7 beta-sandwich domain-containing protein n=1 Tax=Meloidogyne incognita TaxID=6306 RepID=A0A914N9P2_MELIC
MFYLLKLYLFLLFFVHQSYADVIGCEGFVKSAFQINLSDMKVKLFTSQGNLKYEAECNPQNGYFLIPIYNKGKYLVKIIASDGYVFEPKLYEIEIGNNGGCSEELNFNLTGLKISGKILDGEDSSLVLGIFKQEDGELVGKTIVDKDGNYNFVTWPGKYVISPFSGSTKCLSQGSIKIEVGTTPLIIKPDLRIEGYSLEVNVVDEKGDPFLYSNVVLQSDKQIKTNSSGSTLINCLPPGKYVVNAEQKVLNFGEANFDEKFVDMNFRTTKVTISVKSFNLNGIVFTAKQAPLQNLISANILPNQIEIDLKRGPIFNLLFVNQTKFLTTDEKGLLTENMKDIKLFNSEDDLIYTSTCNSESGYFLIPIFNKGKYLVKIFAPDGYVFEHKLHRVEIGNNGGCSEELNFTLTGLEISGRILNGEDSSLVLGLFKQEDGELVGKTIVDKDGNYNFVACPGVYFISLVSGSTQCLSQGQAKIEVGTTPMKIKPDLRIEGLSLVVNVVDERGDPYLLANVILQADNQINFENLPLSAEQPITINEGQKWFYKFDTNYGSTLINCLSPGKYIINAKQKVLDYIEANFDEKFVEMSSRIIEVTVSVKSINLSGYILTGKQARLENVTIKLDGKFKTMTDKEGKFFVSNVSPGMHVLAVEKEHFEFNELNFDVSSKTKKLITFFPNRIAVCGRVLADDEVKGIFFKVYSLDENIFIDGVVTNFEGKFCKMLTPGKYTITPISKLLLSPSKVEIHLKEEPILDLKFTQHKSKISGTINCLKKCGKISIKLFDEHGEIVDEFVDTKGEYYFSDVLPSKYT